MENKDLYGILSNVSDITIKEILIPSIIILITSFLLARFDKHYVTKTGKDKYLIFLKDNSQSVSDFLQKISAYNSYTSIKCLILFEGVLFGIIYSVKVINYIFSIADNLVNSFLINIFPNLILYTSKKYDNFNVDLFVFVSTFNYISVITGFIIFGWLIFLENKNYSLSRLTEELYLTKWSIFVHYSYWFFIGTLVGINILIMFFTGVSISYFSSINFDFSNIWIYIYNMSTNLVAQIPAKKGLDIVFRYAIGLFLSFSSLMILYFNIIGFSAKFKKQVTNFYNAKFPYVTIKMESGEINGQLYNFENKSMLILNGNNILKAVPWDQIRTMEMNNKEEINSTKIINCKSLHPR
ncbi:hypothetical protein [Methanosarcina acetivorans]|uniref:hypothetical protein n=1 Tax=Methanosarcina acetivorans TaxID=2214 RepID=UPI00064EA09A|nr:hypothetical protein [Methanosarcina acetivorans]